MRASIKTPLIRTACRTLLALAALLVACSNTLFAQRTVVSGKVYDAETREPLPFVNLAFQDGKVGTTTNIDGAYRLETYYASDSLVATFIGYSKTAMKVKRDREQVIDFFLKPSSVGLGEVVISAKDYENPAHIILRRIVANKPVNNRTKLDAYQYETYNRVEFDLNNISDKFRDRKVFNQFDFIFDYVDSSQTKVSLPFFITESLSDFYYQRQPRGRKEIIHGTKVSGINNESISQFLGQMYQEVNVYENSINIFGKNFISPISNYGLAFYKYFLVDSMFIDSKWCYRLDFLPKNETELVFEGHFWVNDTTYALKEIEAKILKSANINFITDLRVHHNYNEVEPEVWMLIQEELVADFNVVDKEMGFYGKKLATYRDFVINKPKDPEFYSGAENVIVETQVNELSSEFWKQSRHVEISEHEQGIYNMVDSLKNNGIFMTYVDLINFLFLGYKIYGNVEVGSIFTFLSVNSVEGLRPKFGLRTSNAFSTRTLLEGYLAYGTRDKRFKYSLGGQYFLSKKPRQTLGAYYSEDLELIGQTPNFFVRDHFINFLAVRNPQDRLILNKQARIYTEREWFSGFSTLLEFRRRELRARGAWEFLQPVATDDGIDDVDVGPITSSEISIGARFAYREKFLSGEFERVSLGSRYPILKVRVDFGVEDLLGGDYTYQRLTATVSDKIPMGPFGTMKFTIEGGKTWQSLPFVLQFVHAGNESFFYNSEAFNTMNFFEFVSDRYISGRAEHHFEGFFFNKIPLFQKLKFREIVGVNGIYGRFGDGNFEELLLPANTYRFDSRPFAEAYVGVENIFKFFRVDAIWRLSYLELDRATKFSILIGFDITF